MSICPCTNRVQDLHEPSAWDEKSFALCVLGEREFYTLRSRVCILLVPVRQVVHPIPRAK